METNARTQSHAGISTENTADGDTADDSRDIGDRNRKVNNRRSGARNAKAKGGKSKTHSGGNGDGDGTSIVSRTFSKTIRDTEWAYLHLELYVCFLIQSSIDQVFFALGFCLFFSP